MQATMAAASDVVRRGTEIYETRLRAVLEPEHIGEYLAIDVETGEYILVPTRAELTRRTFEQGLSSSRFAMRVGYATYMKRPRQKITRHKSDAP